MAEVYSLERRMEHQDGLSHRQYAEMQFRGEGTYLIAWDGGEPVGRLFVRRRNNPEIPRIVDRYPQAARFAECPEFCDIEVVSRRRSQGIGTQLLNQGLERARQWGGGR